MRFPYGNFFAVPFCISKMFVRFRFLIGGQRYFPTSKVDETKNNFGILNENIMFSVQCSMCMPTNFVSFFLQRLYTIYYGIVGFVWAVPISSQPLQIQLRFNKMSSRRHIHCRQKADNEFDWPRSQFHEPNGQTTKS